MLWTEYRPVIKIGPKGALGNHEIRPIHSAPSLGQSIGIPETNFHFLLTELNKQKSGKVRRRNFSQNDKSGNPVIEQ